MSIAVLAFGGALLLAAAVQEDQPMLAALGLGTMLTGAVLNVTVGR